MSGEPINHAALKGRLSNLREEHSALDVAVAAMAETGVVDQLKMARLKKQKLILRDEIAFIEDQLRPDIIA